MPEAEKGATMGVSVDASSNVTEDNSSSMPFASILELFKVGTMEFFMEFDVENQTNLLATNMEDLKGKPDSYKQRFDTLCQIYSIHVDIIGIMIKNIKKNIFLLEEDCNPELAEPVGMLYDESDFCCCSESSMGGFMPVMTTSRGAKPFMTTMKTSMGSSGNSNCKCSNKITMTTKGPSMKTTQRTNPTKSFKLRYRKL